MQDDNSVVDGDVGDLLKPISLRESSAEQNRLDCTKHCPCPLQFQNNTGKDDKMQSEELLGTTPVGIDQSRLYGEKRKSMPVNSVSNTVILVKNSLRMMSGVLGKQMMQVGERIPRNNNQQTSGIGSCGIQWHILTTENGSVGSVSESFHAQT